MALALWINKQNFSGELQEYYMLKGIACKKATGEYVITIAEHHMPFVALIPATWG
jgi:hypothetical protein